MNRFIVMLVMLASTAAFGQQPTTTPTGKATPAITPSQNQMPPLTGSEKVDINHADQSTLERLPGVGPKLAQAIVTYREQNGEFVLPADVMRVPGIREGRFAQIKPWISADAEGTMLWHAEGENVQPKPTQQPQR